MSTRDDLASLIEFGAVTMHSFEQIADAILKTGWRPPARVIEAVEDLENLLEGTIFKGDEYGSYWEKYNGVFWWGNEGLKAEEVFEWAAEYEMGTLRVIWEPEEA